MNEFNRLKWDFTSDKSYLEKQVCTFVSNEALSGSYVYQGLRNRLAKPPELEEATTNFRFTPGETYIPHFPRKSLLTNTEQEQCLQAMKVLMLNKPPHLLKHIESTNIEIFKNLRYKISQEHEIFSQFVKNAWENDKKILQSKNIMYKYALLMNEMKAKRYLDYKRYYKEEDQINMTFYENNEIAVEVKCIGILLELGTLARFSQPSLKLECKLSAKTLPPIQSIRINSKLTVSKDENVRALLRNHNFDVVISSSGLKRLLDVADSKEKWTVPVVVELVKVKRGAEMQTRKIVFIDKPFVKINPDPLDLKYYSMKKLIKTNFCHYEAFKFQNQEHIFEDKDIQLDKEDEEKSSGEDRKFSWKKKGDGNDIIHHNVNYRLWKVQKNVISGSMMKNQTKSAELNLLIRSKLDACESTQGQTLLPVIVTPKIELQLQYGANLPTKSELSREWTSLFFRPYSNLYRVRMHGNSAEVIKLEKCPIQKVANDAVQLYEYKPHLGLGVLNDILTKLTSLNEGNYLLAHLPKHGSFLGLYRETERLFQSFIFGFTFPL